MPLTSKCQATNLGAGFISDEGQRDEVDFSVILWLYKLLSLRNQAKAIAIHLIFQVDCIRHVLGHISQCTYVLTPCSPCVFTVHQWKVRCCTNSLWTHAERRIEHDGLCTRVSYVGAKHIKQMKLVKLSTYFKVKLKKMGKQHTQRNIHLSVHFANVFPLRGLTWHFSSTYVLKTNRWMDYSGAWCQTKQFTAWISSKQSSTYWLTFQPKPQIKSSFILIIACHGKHLHILLVVRINGFYVLKSSEKPWWPKLR